MNAPRLLAITPGEAGLDLRPWIEALGEARLPALLIREPHLDASELGRLAEAASRIVPLVVLHTSNPHAAELGWPLHVPAGASAVGAVGASCHDRAELDAAFAAGVTYALLSPVWTPTSKPADRRRVLGVDRFLALAAGRPVLALGGLDAGRLRAVVDRGGWGGAVLGGLFGALSPEQAGERCRQLVAVLESGETPPPTLRR